MGFTIKWGLLSSGAYFPNDIFEKSLSQKSCSQIMYYLINRIILNSKIDFFVIYSIFLHLILVNKIAIDLIHNKVFFLVDGWDGAYF